MGMMTLKSYNTTACAAKCTKMNGCMSFNIYFERDPTVDPGTGASGCTNPASTTLIKCAFWGGPVNAANALNYGQWQNQFQVVIAGSNGYVNTTEIAPAGYSAPLNLNNAAINAPFDIYGGDTYMGSAIFNSGPFNVSLCADACSKKSAYNLAHPPTDGSPVKTCQFINTYILYKNTTANLVGQYCAMYTESWNATYATNVGQWRGYDHYLIESSWAFSNATNPGAASPIDAVYQASKDISYATLQPFCSSYLGYSAQAVATATSTSYTTPISTSTVTVTASTTTVAANQKRIVVEALSTPNVLTKYPSAILSSACSMQATAATAASSTTTVQTVVTASASITTLTTSVVATSTSTITSSTAPQSTNFYLQSGNTRLFASLNTNLTGSYPGVTFNATSMADATEFTLNSDGQLAIVGGPFGGSGAFFDLRSAPPFPRNPYVRFGPLSAPSNAGSTSDKHRRLIQGGNSLLLCTINSDNSLNCNESGDTNAELNSDWVIVSSGGDGTPVTIYTVPVPAPSSSTTTTASSTATSTSSTSSGATAQPTFYLQSGNTRLFANLDTSLVTSYQPGVTFNATDTADATMFTLDSYGALTIVGGRFSGDQAAWEPTSQAETHYVFFDSYKDIVSSNQHRRRMPEVEFMCTINSDNSLSCPHGDGNTDGELQSDWVINQAGGTAMPLTIYTVPIASTAPYVSPNFYLQSGDSHDFATVSVDSTTGDIEVSFSAATMADADQFTLNSFGELVIMDGLYAGYQATYNPNPPTGSTSQTVIFDSYADIVDAGNDSPVVERATTCTIQSDSSLACYKDGGSDAVSNGIWVIDTAGGTDTPVTIYTVPVPAVSSCSGGGGQGALSQGPPRTSNYLGAVSSVAGSFTASRSPQIFILADDCSLQLNSGPNPGWKAYISQPLSADFTSASVQFGSDATIAAVGGAQLQCTESYYNSNPAYILSCGYQGTTYLNAAPEGGWAMALPDAGSPAFVVVSEGYSQ